MEINEKIELFLNRSDFWMISILNEVINSDSKLNRKLNSNFSKCVKISNNWLNWQNKSPPTKLQFESVTNTNQNYYELTVGCTSMILTKSKFQEIVQPSIGLELWQPFKWTQVVDHVTYKIIFVDEQQQLLFVFPFQPLFHKNQLHQF